jgi:type I restriction enzyme S subunit
VAIGATLGKVGLLEVDGTFNQQIVGLQPDVRVVFPRHLAWIVRGLGAELRDTAPNTTLPILNSSRLATIKIPVPSLDQQLDVTDSLDREALIVENAVAQIEHQVGLLREHRQALITAAVSGQLDVSSAA